MEEQARRELGLPELTEDVRKSWEATGGIRQGKNLKSAESGAINEALGVAEDNAPDYRTEQRLVHSKALSADKPSKPEGNKLAEALEDWLGPLAKELLRLADDEDLSEEEFGKALAACAEGKKSGSTEKFETFLEEQIYDGLAYGVTR